MARKNIKTHSRKKKAVSLLQGRQYPEARDILLEVVRIDSRDAESWKWLAESQRMLGDRQGAIHSLSRLLELKPGNPGGHYQLGLLYQDLGQHDKALEMLEKALFLKADDTEIIHALGSLLITLHIMERAEQVFKQYTRIRPGNAEGFSNLGAVQSACGKLAEACSNYRKAIELNPELTDAYQYLGNTLAVMGEYTDSVAAYKKCLAIKPGNPKAISNYLLTLNYIQDMDNRHILNEHRYYGGLYCSGAGSRQHNVTNITSGKLRIAYVSSDFRQHSVAYFMEPVLEHHGRDNFEIFCYYGAPVHDAVTERFVCYADHWREIYQKPVQSICERIERDNIDILIDLAGHTAGGHLAVFCQKPAPVQITYLGYPNTTGINALDYRITDALTDPEGMDAFYTEKLLRVRDCFLCYRPPTDCPPIGDPPRKKNGIVTFGSFNNLAKIGSQVIRLWARLLEEMPDSRLIIKNPSLSDNATRTSLLDKFRHEGISPGRVELLGLIREVNAHLALYNRIDIALDTFPYNGTTNTCEALWMGVPVITLRGNRHAARVGASLLNAAGLPRFIAETEDELIEIAQQVRQDQGLLPCVRQEMRAWMSASPLLDGAAFTRKLEALYLEVSHSR